MKYLLSSEELSRRARQAVARPSFIHIINHHIRSCVLPLLAAQVVSYCYLFVQRCPTSLVWSLGTNDPPGKGLRVKISALLKFGSMGQDSGSPLTFCSQFSGNRWVLALGQLGYSGTNGGTFVARIEDKSGHPCSAWHSLSRKRET